MSTGAPDGSSVPGKADSPAGPDSPADAVPPDVRRVAAAVVLAQGRVLVQTRPAPGRWQGYWEFPGGGVEPGEDSAACARRECLEELGLSVRVGEVLEQVSWAYGEVTVEVCFLRCELDGPGEPEARLGQELAWADAAELRRLRFLPANAALVARLAAELER